MNSSSPYLGSFNFSGLKNLILPSFNPSIRWLYGCAAEGKHIITGTHICDTINPFSVFQLSITAEHAPLTYTLRPALLYVVICCNIYLALFRWLHTKMVILTWRILSCFIHLSSCSHGKEFCLVMQHLLGKVTQANCNIYAKPVQPWIVKTTEK